ncbi:MAG: DUF4097 family beta strand repeat protein [Bacteroidetes bacterium]|nr:DUF4097 family beta strand repeat protein [Bacteroidota bacterium]
MKHFTTAILLLSTLMIAYSSSVAQRQKQTQSFTVTKGGTLDVSVDGGDIRISTWEKNEVTVNVNGYDDDESDVRITQQGNTIRVTDRGGWSDGGLFTVSVPSHFNLNIRTSLGDISVRGKIAGSIACETSAGNIRTDDVDGDIDLRTSGGDVRTGRITGKTTVSTSGGDIEVASSLDELDVRTAGGDIRVGNVSKSMRARTAGGDIIIGDVGGEANASTAGGNVIVGKVSGQVTLSTSGGDVELSAGTGTIKATTSGGNIKLTNISGSVDAKTSGGDIRAELVPGGKGKSRLVSASGTITLLVPENAKATITARICIPRRWRSKKDTYTIRSD